MQKFSHRHFSQHLPLHKPPKSVRKDFRTNEGLIRLRTRWLCVLTDGDGRYRDLDLGFLHQEMVRIEAKPGLSRQPGLSGSSLEEVAFQNPVCASCGILSKTKAKSVPRVPRYKTDQCCLCADGAEFGRSKIAGWCFEVSHHISSNVATGSGTHLPAVLYRHFSDLLVGFFATLEVPLAFQDLHRCTDSSRLMAVSHGFDARS